MSNKLSTKKAISFKRNSFRFFEAWSVLIQNFWTFFFCLKNHLMGQLGRLSSDFFKQFPSIQTVYVAGVVDRDQFKWFLEKASQLRKLILTNTSLSQEFMENLPGLNHGLTHLQITESSNSVTSFDFDRLIEFRTERHFKDAVNLAAKMFRKIKFFNIFMFRGSMNEKVGIQRDLSSENRFRLKCSSKGRTKFFKNNLRLTKLIAFCEQREAEVVRSRLQQDSGLELSGRTLWLVLVDENLVPDSWL